MDASVFDFGMIGLGTMGRNFLLNMADHHIGVAGFDLDKRKIHLLESSASPGIKVKGVATLEEMITLLQAPRKIMMLVPAGKAVDDVIENLLPLLQKGDVIMDGGNSFYVDTLRRMKYVYEKGFHFMGIGISGGEEGARNGPSIMPGGNSEAYATVEEMFKAVAAKVNGESCVAYMGKGAAGHYVKMVHNGIEYALMQLISEVYWLMKKGMNYSNEQIASVFKEWNEGEMNSFLLQVTCDVLLQKDDKTKSYLIDMIRDRAGSKGTGKWTSQEAMNLGVPVPSIDIAVAMRNLSSFSDERSRAAKQYRNFILIPDSSAELLSQLHDALYSSSVISYAQGFSMLKVASKELSMEIPLKEVVKIWRGGCIIRSSLLELFVKVFQKNPGLENILLDESVSPLLNKKEYALRKVIVYAAQSGLPVAGLMTAQSYFDSYRSAQLPANLIQAQRDFFGAHTFERTDIPGTFHADWKHDE